eukprot:1242419-Rhodomonas_salina.7
MTAPLRCVDRRVCCGLCHPLRVSPGHRRATKEQIGDCGYLGASSLLLGTQPLDSCYPITRCRISASRAPQMVSAAAIGEQLRVRRAPTSLEHHSANCSGEKLVSARLGDSQRLVTARHLSVPAEGTVFW